MIRDNFENVQVGDVVIFTTYGFGGSTRNVMTVEKVTKTRFVVNGVQFVKETGKAYGSNSWHIPDVSWPKDGEIEEIKREDVIKNIYYKLSKIKIEDITYEKALQLNDMFGFYKQENE